MDYFVLTPGLEVRSSHKGIEICILEPSRTFVNMGLSHLMASSVPGRKKASVHTGQKPWFPQSRCYATSVMSSRAPCGATKPVVQECGFTLLPEARKRDGDLNPLLVPSACLCAADIAAFPFFLFFLKSLLWPPVSHSSTAPECWISSMFMPPHLALAQCLCLKLHLGSVPGPT